MGERAGVAGKSLQIPMQILLPVMEERIKEDWVGRDFVCRSSEVSVQLMESLRRKFAF